PAKRPSQKRRGLACRPCTLHQHTSQIPIAPACSPLTAFPRTFVVAWRQACPRRQPGRRAKTCHVQANLGQTITCCDLVDAWNTVELLELRSHRAEQLVELLINVDNLPTQHVDQLQRPGNELSVMCGKLPCESHFELRNLPTQTPKRHD